VINWHRLRGLSNQKIVVSTSMWVFIVPIIFKIPIEASFTQCSNIYCFNINFFILYFSGLSFFIGGVVFSIFCPRFIKDYSSFSDFINKGGSNVTLNSHVINIGKKRSKNLYDEIMKTIEHPSRQDIDNINKGVSYISLGLGKQDKKSDNDKICIYFTREINVIFTKIYDMYINVNPLILYISTFFYTLGFIGLLYMFVRNFIYVFNKLI